MTTQPAKVNRALAAAGIAVEIVRDPSGYYWFSNGDGIVPSILAHSLIGYTTEEIVEHVKTAFAKFEQQKGN